MGPKRLSPILGPWATIVQTGPGWSRSSRIVFKIQLGRAYAEARIVSGRAVAAADHASIHHPYRRLTSGAITLGTPIRGWNLILSAGRTMW